MTHSTGADKETSDTNTTTVIGMKNTSIMNNCSDAGQYVYEFLIPVSLLPFIMYVLILDIDGNGNCMIMKTREKNKW